MPYVHSSGGRLQAHKIEYNLVDHCNLACRECSHLSPYLRAHALPLTTFIRDVNRLAEVYRVRRFRFVGGEPLLNREICDFVRAVRDSGVTEEIEVVSNGTLLGAISEELLQAIDSLALSLYPRSQPEAALLERTRERCDQAGVKLRIDQIDRFRKMQPSAPIEDPRLVADVFRSCLIAHSWGCQTFYDGQFYLCSRPIYTDSYRSRMSEPEFGLRAKDGIALHEPKLLERLRCYLESQEPLVSCKLCLGTVGKYEAHSQLSAKARWHPAGGAQPVEQKIDYARMRQLTRWREIEAAILQRIPSRHLSRAMSMAQTAWLGD